jgi:hypothetical protein
MGHDFNDSLRELLQRQRGVLSRQQALAAGLSDGLIRTRLRSDRWRQIQFGVYATFTGECSREVLMWAAVLGAGTGASLSHHSAAELDRLVKEPAALIHVTVPASRRVTPGPGVVIHVSGRVLQARDPSRLPPRTRIEETVLDLVANATTAGDAFEWLCRACGGRHTTPERIRAAMAARRKLRWRGEISEALGDVARGVHSGLERRYLRDVERPHGLPVALRQARVVRGGAPNTGMCFTRSTASPSKSTVPPPIRPRPGGSTATVTTQPPPTERSRSGTAGPMS